jgi:demethylmenaquinone methyltransferase/2-methoxy-6-polyprenyl-1,4-benzoquinol methylase
MSAGARSGTLEEGQVRAMFDRIAGPYDLMNSVMTAGLHHRWRERAVDLARVGPGSRALDVATGTGDLAIEAVSLPAAAIFSERSKACWEASTLRTYARRSAYKRAFSSATSA